MKDPPPDLMLEVEYTRKVEGRLPIIASFKIPEVWRYGGEQLIVLQLQPRKGQYVEVEESRAIPDFPFDNAPRFLDMGQAIDISYAEIGRLFRKWVRSQISKKSK
jgi:hypothetical protein